MEQKLPIRAVAARYHVSARTLRFYEEIGLLPSQRREGGRTREYGPEQLRRLEVILLLRRLSFSVQEIAGLLCGGAKRFTGALLERIAASDRQLIEVREKNRLLRNVWAELSVRPQEEADGAELPDGLVHLTKQTERLVYGTMAEKEFIDVALGREIATEVCAEQGGDLIGKIKSFRQACEANGRTLPLIHICDKAEIPAAGAQVSWDGTEHWSGDFAGQDAAACAEALMDVIRRLYAET